jgi:hypothetical protein
MPTRRVLVDVILAISAASAIAERLRPVTCQ